MLTGEYLALTGAKTLALATSAGQSLEVTECASGKIDWKSFDSEKQCWFSACFDLEEFAILEYSDPGRVNFIRSIFIELKKMNPQFLIASKGVEIKTYLQFDKDWGLGSSSTLLTNLGSWAEVDAFDLLAKTLGGSGYDIAVAQTGTHVFYSNQPKIEVQETSFDPDFKENLFFIYLNKKQSSAKEVSKFLGNAQDFSMEMEVVSKLSEDIAKSESLQDFEELIEQHNMVMSNVLRRPSAQENFADYSGGVLKYLGAWGGDFMLATGTSEQHGLFYGKRLYNIIPFEDMIK